MSLVAQGAKAKCLLKALVSGVLPRGIVKVNIEVLVFQQYFEILETKLKVGGFRSALSLKTNEN